MQEIMKELCDRYSMDIIHVIPYKDSFILNTCTGRKILKKSVLSPERILFVDAAKEHLYAGGFTRLDRYLHTDMGLPYVTVDGACYTVNEYIEGTGCNFDDERDVAEAAILLANMHKASRGFTCLPEGSKAQDELGKLVPYFTKRLDEIKKLKKVARKGKSKFDYLFLECVDYFYTLGEDTLRHFPGEVYERLCEKARQEGTLCHHDYTHHNIIAGVGGFHIINFEYCCVELKVYDIANFLRRKMRKCDWNLDAAGMILDCYRTVEPVSPEEFEVLKAILRFPQKFWRVVNRYYNSKRTWSEKSYIQKLQEVIDEIPRHGEFMNGIDKIM